MLETNVQRIGERLDAAYREIDRAAGELYTKIKGESEARNAAIGEVKKNVEEAATGNLAALAFGVVWLAIGIVLSTLAPEIVKLVGGQWREVWRAL
jgi:hypothetical protein